MGRDGNRVDSRQISLITIRILFTFIYSHPCPNNNNNKQGRMGIEFSYIPHIAVFYFYFLYF